MEFSTVPRLDGIFSKMHFSHSENMSKLSINVATREIETVTVVETSNAETRN